LPYLDVKLIISYERLQQTALLFFSVGIERWQKINVLFARWLFSTNVEI